DPAAHDDAAADAGAQGDHDGAAAALGRAHPDLTQGGHVGVVAHQNLHAVQQQGQVGGHILLAPAAQVGADDGHHAGILYRAGHADAHALDLVGGQALFLHLVQDGGGQVGQDADTLVGGV